MYCIWFLDVKMKLATGKTIPHFNKMFFEGERRYFHYFSLSKMSKVVITELILQIVNVWS